MVARLRRRHNYNNLFKELLIRQLVYSRQAGGLKTSITIYRKGVFSALSADRSFEVRLYVGAHVRRKSSENTLFAALRVLSGEKARNNNKKNTN